MSLHRTSLELLVQLKVHRFVCTYDAEEVWTYPITQKNATPGTAEIVAKLNMGSKQCT